MLIGEDPDAESRCALNCRGIKTPATLGDFAFNCEPPIVRFNHRELKIALNGHVHANRLQVGTSIEYRSNG